MVGKDRELRSRGGQPGKLQPRVEGRSLAGLILERNRIAVFEARANFLPAFRALDHDEAPRFAEANGRSEACESEKAVQRPLQKRLAFESPNITTPEKQVEQFCAEGRAKFGSAGDRCFCGHVSGFGIG